MENISSQLQEIQEKLEKNKQIQDSRYILIVVSELLRNIRQRVPFSAGSPTQSFQTWEDRNQPNPKDRYILVESRPELVIRRGQGKFKTKDHGARAEIKANASKNRGKRRDLHRRG